MRLDPVDGGTIQLAATVTPSGLAVDEAFVYWTSPDGGVLKLPKSGGTPESLSVETSNTWTNYGNAIAVDQHWVYWSIDTLYDGKILRVRK